MIVEHWWSYWPRIRRKPYPTATVLTTSSTWTGLDLNSGLKIRVLLALAPNSGLRHQFYAIFLQLRSIHQFGDARHVLLDSGTNDVRHCDQCSVSIFASDISLQRLSHKPVTIGTKTNVENVARFFLMFIHCWRKSLVNFTNRLFPTNCTNQGHPTTGY